MCRTRRSLNLLDCGTFKGFNDLLKGLFCGFTGRFIGNFANFIGKVALIQKVETRSLKAGKLSNLGTRKDMGSNHFLHSFLCLPSNIGKWHIGHLAFQNDIKVGSGYTSQLTFLFSFLDQSRLLLR